MSSWFRFLIAFLLALSAADVYAWRSALYPEDWQPQPGEDGYFLHDFSYAGYHRSEKPLPEGNWPLLNAAEAPYFADPTGEQDATDAIQQALTDAGERGRGVVLLPEGTYRLSKRGNAILRIRHSHVVLRGAGKHKTRLFNADPYVREVRFISVRPEARTLRWPGLEPRRETLLAADAPNGSRTLRLNDASGFQTGEWIVVTSDASPAWLAEHGMQGIWNKEALWGGVAFLRRIEQADAALNEVWIDIPLRYPLKTRDRARIFSIKTAPLTEIGIEHLSVGSRSLNLPPGRPEAYDEEADTVVYHTHGSVVFDFTHTVDSWVRDVATFAPPGNLPQPHTGEPVHIPSNGIRLSYTRNITLTGCDFRFPQNLGGGGNGYLYTFGGNDDLLTDSMAVGGRHNVSFRWPSTSGNVVHDSVLSRGLLPSDYHMFFSPANLFDRVRLDRETLAAAYRKAGRVPHGHGTTQSVFWNITSGECPRRAGVSVISGQYGKGYVIGTSGQCSEVKSDGDDWIEGIGKAARLEPQSLYESQLVRRLHSHAR